MSAEAPAAYLSGRQTFMGVELLAAPGALVPRAETELLGGTALETLQRLLAIGVHPLVVDMCCGSGNLACALASRVPEARLWAADLTDGCVTLTRRNVEHLALGSRVTVCQGDLFAAVGGQGLEGRLDMIVCNPPYISTGRLAKDRANLLEHEPREAFDGGPYGISIQQRVIRDAPAFLKSGASLLFEIGLGQERQVQGLFERSGAYQDIRIVANAEGQPRVLGARKR